MTDTTTDAADVTETPPTQVQKLAAEALGTFVLVFIGCGTAVISGVDYVATALAFGLTVLTMVYAVGRVSGGHFNPAVSVGAAISGRISWIDAALYIAAQVAAGIVAAGALFAILFGIDGYEYGDGVGANAFGDLTSSEFAWWSAFLVEFLLTAIFVWVILGATDARSKPNSTVAPIAIGLALTMVHLFGIGVTGTSVNPARSIGPALFTDTDHMIQLWLFIAAPLLGGLIAGLTYPLIFGRDADPVPGSGLDFGSGAKPAQFGAGHDQQWNPGQAGGWQQPQQQWGAAPAPGAPAAPPAPPAPAQQPWNAPPPPPPAPGQQPWGAPGGDQPYGAPQAPAQQPWGAPPSPDAGGQTPGQPGHWGNPEGDDDGRTQVRRPD